MRVCVRVCVRACVCVCVCRRGVPALNFPPKRELNCFAVGTVGVCCAGHICRGHSEDIFDIAWSPDSTRLVTGSVDNTAIVWDRKTGKVLQKLEDHGHFVQGVAWHPTNKMVVTQSSDRSCRVYKQSETGKKGYTCVPRLTATRCRRRAPPRPHLVLSGI